MIAGAVPAGERGLKPQDMQFRASIPDVRATVEEELRKRQAAHAPRQVRWMSTQPAVSKPSGGEMVAKGSNINTSIIRGNNA